jgi:hypothetical protein
MLLARIGGLIVLLLSGAEMRIFGQSPRFTYQGRLSDSGDPANGVFDLRLTIYDSLLGGNAAGGPITNANTVVSNGLFAVQLNCAAGAFTGADRWLEIAVRTNGSSGAYQELSPRQPLTPTPYALRAASATSFAGLISDSQLSTNVARLGSSTQVFTGTVQFSNAASSFAGSFVGNGAGLSNIDTAVRVFPGNVVIGPQGQIDTTGTTTAGIQEAIYALPQAADANSAGGGTVVLAPGTYYTTETILVDCIPSRTNPVTIKLVGPGRTAGGITYAGTTPKSAIKVGRPYGFNRVGFEASGLWVASVSNWPTNIIYLAGFSDGAANYATGPFGGIYSATIRDCWVGWWDAMTNNSPFGFAPGERFDDSPGKHNLVGVDVVCNYGGAIVIENCFFDGCMGVGWATDHGTIRGNQFQNCGIGAFNQVNDWPSTSPFFMGAAITCREPPELWNGNDVWSFENNIFINCFLPYFAGNGHQDHPLFSYGDQIEPGPIRDFVATAGRQWTAVNPHIYAGDLRPFTSNWIVTNLADYSSWRTLQDTTNCVRLSLPPVNNSAPAGSFLRSDGLLSFWSLDAGALTNVNVSSLTGTLAPAQFPSSGWTNASTFTETTPCNMTLNAWQTNVNQRMQYTFRFAFSPGPNDPVHAELLVDNDSDGIWDKTLTVGYPASPHGNYTNSFSTIIGPNARFTFTNYSGNGASFTLIDVIKEGL